MEGKLDGWNITIGHSFGGIEGHHHGFKLYVQF
jgi:hypothetical protein